MTLQLRKFQEFIRQQNETKIAALECAVFVLNRACELSPGQRVHMIELLKDALSIESGKEDPTSQDPSLTEELYLLSILIPYDDSVP